MQLLLLPATATFDMWMKVDLNGDAQAGGLRSATITRTCIGIITALKSAAAAASGLSPVFKVPAWDGNPGSGVVCNLTDAAAQAKCICAGTLVGDAGAGWMEFNVMWSDKLGVKMSSYAALLTQASFFRAAGFPCAYAANPQSITIASYGSCAAPPDQTYWGPNQGGCAFGFLDKSGYLLAGGGVAGGGGAPKGVCIQIIA